MAFTLDDLVIDRIQMAVAEKTDGTLLYTLLSFPKQLSKQPQSLRRQSLLKALLLRNSIRVKLVLLPLLTQ